MILMGWIQSLFRGGRDINELEKGQQAVPDGHIENKLHYAYECYKAEHERRRRIETKAASLLTIIGVVATLITAGVIRLFLKNYNYGTLEYSLMIALFLITFFMGLSCYYAVKVLRTEKYEFLVITDFKDYNDNNYYEEFIKKLNEYVEHNIPLGQRKSKEMGKAQEWFKWSVIVLMVYSSLLSFYYIFDKMSDFVNSLSGKFVAVGTESFVTWTTVAVFVMALTAIIMSIIALCKIRTLSKKEE